MRIAMVDDNAVNRDNFMQKTKAFPELEVCVIALDGNDFLEKMKELAVALLPQIVFMDLQMPGLNGVETIRRAKAIYHTIHFIVITVFEDDDIIFDAILAGASGYLLKHDSDNTIRDTIQEVYDFGAAPMSPAIARKALKLLMQQETGSSTGIRNAATPLSGNEREVLQHLINGYDVKRISELAEMNSLSVRKYIADIYLKLHVLAGSPDLSMLKNVHIANPL